MFGALIEEAILYEQLKVNISSTSNSIFTRHEVFAQHCRLFHIDFELIYVASITFHGYFQDNQL